MLCCFPRPVPGSLTSAPKEQIPLLSTHIIACICEFSAEVTINQKYKNTKTTPLEATYELPLDENIAVCGFEAVIDGKRIIGQVDEKDKAVAKYDDAIASGGGAYLAEQVSSDLFRISVGNLPPGKECEIKLKYVTELVAVENRVYFTIERKKFKGTASALSPFNITVNMTSNSKMTEIECSHNYKIKFDDLEKGSAQLSTVIKHDDFTKDFELYITCQQSTVPSCLITQDSKGKEGALMINFLPKLPSAANNLNELIFVVDRSGSMAGLSFGYGLYNGAPASLTNAAPITKCADALQLFLRSLPIGCKFNIVGFGSPKYEFLFPESQILDEASLETASHYVAKLDASFGGTDLMNPIVAIESIPADPAYTRQVIILTDGQVDLPNQVIEQVRVHCQGQYDPAVREALTNNICSYTVTKQKHTICHWFECYTCNLKAGEGVCAACKVRCHAGHNVSKNPRFGLFFCDCGANPLRCTASHPPQQVVPVDIPTRRSRYFGLGIGSDVSISLVTGIAEAGNGAYEFAPNTKDNIDSKVIRQLRKALEPSITNIQIEYRGLSAADYRTAIPPPIFNNHLYFAYALLNDKNKLPTAIVIRGADNSASIEIVPKLANSSQIAQLAAKSIIKSLENHETGKEEIIQLGKRYQLASKYTSFVAVEERDESTQGPMQTVAMNKPILSQNTPISHNHFAYQAAPSYNASPAFSFPATSPVQSAFGIFGATSSSTTTGFPSAISSQPQMAASFSFSSPSVGSASSAFNAHAPAPAPAPASGYSSFSAFNPKPTPPLTALAIRQKLAGNWELDDKFCEVLKISRAAASQALPQGCDTMKWATVLALAFLQLALAHLKNDWSLMSQKSEKWLIAEIQQRGSSIPQATQLLANWMLVAEDFLAKQGVKPEAS